MADLARVAILVKALVCEVLLADWTSSSGAFSRDLVNDLVELVSHVRMKMLMIWLAVSRLHSRCVRSV